MLSIGIQYLLFFFRVALFLMVSGELVTSTLDMRENARHSLSRGIMSIGDFNRSLHKK